MSIPTGARARLIHDVAAGVGNSRPYPKGTTIIIDDYVSAEESEEEGGAFYWASLADDHMTNVTFLESDLELDATAEQVAAEPKEFTITGKVSVEITKRFKASTAAEAELLWHHQGSAVFEDWDEMDRVEFEPLDAYAIGEKGVDY